MIQIDTFLPLSFSEEYLQTGEELQPTICYLVQRTMTSKYPLLIILHVERIRNYEKNY